MALRQESPPSLGSQVLLDPFRDPGPPLANEDFDDDEFEDAEEEQQESKMDLRLAFDECTLALRKFFNNDVAGAMSIMKPWSSTSLYHSLGMSIFEFIPAMLTFDHTQICNALEAIKICLAICNKHRKNYSLVEHFKKHNYNNVTDLQAHAELCYAEALLLQAAMTILEGEDLAGLIKGTIKVKTCYNSYKECEKMLEKKEWATEASRVNFHSGVRLGLATFNVMISLLPSKFISVLEFVGFSGNKALGLAELEAGSNSPGLRSVLCELTLLAYHLAICHFSGGDCNLEISEQILNKELKVYPSGVWFLLFQGRLEFMRGRFDEALVTYGRAVSSQNMWRQFSYFCYWEMAWVNCLKMCWRDAALYTTRLIEESSWSRTIYSYFKAAILLQLREDITPLERQQINDLMRNASYYKQRIAGKSLPMEKFMIKRCARYEAQGGQLVLPAVELICLWNMFSLLANNERDAQNMLKIIEATLAELESGTASWAEGYAADNLCLARYLHGCWLSAMALPRSALDQLATVFQYKNDIKEDTFILPYAMAEMAMCYYNLGDTERAISTLQEAKKKYSGYSLESRLHLRMHSKMHIFKSKLAATPAENKPKGSKQK